MTPSLCALILQLARESIGWGVRRILGELKKLALPANRSSVRRVLKDENLLPDPDRHAPKGVDTPWRTFIKMHMNVLVACDFFCKTVWTPLGKKTAYVLPFIHLGSRKVFLSPSTYSPTDEWVCQQARNVHMWAEDEGVDLRLLLHDRDTKFSMAFNDHFRCEDGRVIRTPPGAPIASCFAIIHAKPRELGLSRKAPDMQAHLCEACGPLHVGAVGAKGLVDSRNRDRIIAKAHDEYHRFFESPEPREHSGCTSGPLAKSNMMCA